MDLALPRLIFYWVLSLSLFSVALFHCYQLAYGESINGWVKQSPANARDILAKSHPLITFPYTEQNLEVERQLGNDPSAAHLGRIALQPANADAWSRYAIDLHLQRHIDERMAFAVQRAMQLGPNSRSVGISQSIIAAYNWEFASQALRESWLVAFAAAAQDRGELAFQANRAGVSTQLCEVMPQPHRPDLWCKALHNFLRLCSRSVLNPRQKSLCVRSGLQDE